MPKPVKLYGGQRVLDTLSGVFLADTAQLLWIADILYYIHMREQSVILEHHANAAKVRRL